MDFKSTVFDPVFDAFGVVASLQPYGGEASAITAQDRTKGVELTDNALEIVTVRPVASVRRADLDQLGIALSDLDRGSITLNGRTWGISAHQERPTPFGFSDGTVWLILEAE